MNKKHTHDIVSFFEYFILIIVLFIGLGIGLPVYMYHVKQERISQNYYTNQIIDSSDFSKSYVSFWKEYNIILKRRGNTDHNGIISLQEQAKFDEEFFTENGLTVNPVTKVITRTDGTHPTSSYLLCMISNFYPDKPWIKPVCSSL